MPSEIATASKRGIGKTISLFFSIVILLSSVVYLNTIHNEFLWDDENMILRNPTLIDPWTALTHTEGSALGRRPITNFSFGIDRWLFGIRPEGYHMTNIILNAADAALFFFIALRIFRFLYGSTISGERQEIASGTASPRNDSPSVVGGDLSLREARSDLVFLWPAFFSALIFGLHPIHTEAVASFLGRSDLLGSLFYFLGLLFYMKAVEARRFIYYGLFFASYILSLLSKEMAVTLPFIAILYEMTVPYGH